MAFNFCEDAYNIGQIWGLSSNEHKSYSFSLCLFIN